MIHEQMIISVNITQDLEKDGGLPISGGFASYTQEALENGLQPLGPANTFTLANGDVIMYQTWTSDQVATVVGE